ncbi:hypothetical protein JKA74_02940 [Marivirga sp. S37H4]|uniref:Uncharacterized protein n=1 Tax=Marivirga aurantiaca TaxID=2802615 RepID=A0A935C5S7_9BACT|nr:hypothetical protein [Marivirga aurantiaca]MBK6263980.1 hypothetical protein [Marivirga aurantiaca]
MKRLFLTLGIIVGIGILLVSFGETKLTVENQISGKDLIAFQSNLLSSPIDSNSFPSAVHSAFKMSEFSNGNIIQAKEINVHDGKVYEFTVVTNDKKWRLKYTENGQLLDSYQLKNHFSLGL